MQSKVQNVNDYLDELPEERRVIIEKMREVIHKNIPEGFEECISYGMIGYVVPHSLYPPGYHCDPKLPLPFVALASQKNFVALYHMGIYADPEILKWFTEAYPKHTKGKLDMGKSCIRFKKMENIPFELIGELMTKITCPQWIEVYEKNYRNKK